MSKAEHPSDVVWDITYACPLRCTHCYSESGRRPARQLSHGDMLRVADAIVSLRPQAVEFAGGEPLLVKGILEVADRIAQAGISVSLYTSGWTLDPQMADDLTRVFKKITVSVDGADARTHDRIRGRSGSFERAMRALAILDGLSRQRVERGEPPVEFGIDCAVMRSNFDQMEEFCTAIAPRFPQLRFLNFAAAVPAGLASRTGFSDHELVTNEQMRTMTGAENIQRLQSLAPASVQVMTLNNFKLMMHPDFIAHYGFPLMQIEPDGEVRAMPVYEGTVGSLLTEAPVTLWERAVARWSDPFVVETLSPVRSMHEWAEATRRIDYHFGSDAVRRRIDRRPSFDVSPAGAPHESDRPE
ncbi:radical SAM protein [Acrocarpospora catenulata]|uniref:radical SAM protein n=1 Tax=Acrocarpospora catenulata TaxID=2836182 RepID=UPI001BDA7E7A|nr:radical SAM protein [Acrocarpospora catenulata]